ncbi:hypothetical protein [Hansschlegelia zhihuaiae]|uniref:Uncharacterized protein n=1 Tax=Hansschlegelia zhihuaiae TaxID=405005 RepID=A0A4Q0MJK9_9HYPH|nr:hypothetical protein [Hansschlegelia zhihuaiae]RXF73583.1 hypothetical protein EK403_10375 [Hansschlegelia zhihuaiae]
MAELEGVMQRLDAQVGRIKASAAAETGRDEVQELLLQSLALVSEALLRVGRDVRFLKLHFAEKA